MVSIKTSYAAQLW